MGDYGMVKTRGGIYAPEEVARQVHARYDAAQTTHENARHWANADGLSANAANSPGVRKTLIKRSRYEFANNPYINGIIRTLANDTIGTGPRLQMHTGDNSLDDQIEDDFAAWSEAVRLPVKLITARQARARDGECFGMLVNNPRVGLRLDSKIELDVQLLEAEMVASSFFDQSLNELETDGIKLDKFGNALEYTVLPEHPGSLGWTKGLVDPVRVRAEMMTHYFSPDRPGQARGIPETTPALPLCAQMRRWTLATLSAAENIANIGGVITSTGNGAISDDEAPTAMESIEMERNRWLFLPELWDIKQPKAEQPTSTYREFKLEILNEIARCFNMPFNIAAGNSSQYNFASGRLDHQTYYKSIDVERKLLGYTMLERLLLNWLDEWQYMRGRTLTMKQRGHEWFWDGLGHIDPQKEANATLVRLSSGVTTLPREYARQGLDYRKELPKAAAAMGLTLEQFQQRLTARIFEQPITINEAPENEETQRKGN